MEPELRWGKAGLELRACVAQSPEQCSLQSPCQGAQPGSGKGPSLSRMGPVRALEGLPGISDPSTVLPGPAPSTSHTQTHLFHHSRCHPVSCSGVTGALDRAGTPSGTPASAEARGRPDRARWPGIPTNRREQLAGSQRVLGFRGWAVVRSVPFLPLSSHTCTRRQMGSILIPGNAIPSRSFSPPGVRPGPLHPRTPGRASSSGCCAGSHLLPR